MINGGNTKHKKQYIQKYLYVLCDVSTGDISVKELDGDTVDLLSYIEDIISLSISEKSEVKVNVDGLCWIKQQLMTYGNVLGYGIESISTKKDMHVGECRYSLGKSSLYFYQLKTGSYSFVTFQNIEKVVGRKEYITDDAEASEDIEIFNRLKEAYTGNLKYPESRILYTISTISRGIYNRKHSNLGGPWWKTKNIIFKDNHSKDKPFSLYKANIFLEKYCRPGYHGGFDYMSPIAGTYNGPATVLDANSIYPYVSHWNMPFPCIEDAGLGNIPKEYRSDKYFSVLKLEVSLRLKDDGIPMLQRDNSSNLSDNYITECEHLKITVNTFDLKIMHENYDVLYQKCISHVTFATSRDMFSDYIDPLYENKRESTGAERSFNKLLMNGALGTFAKKPYTMRDVCYLSDNNVVLFKKEPLTDEEYYKELDKVSGYVYLGMAITSAARLYLSHMIKKVPGDRYLYSDTDSIHIAGDYIPAGIPISDKMGDFKVEHKFSDVRYKGLKEYIAVEDGKVTFTLAGVSHISTGLLSDIPDWCIGTQRKSIFRQNKARIAGCIKRHKLDRLFEICLPSITLCEDLASGCYFNIVWRPVLSFEKIKKKNHCIIRVQPVSVKTLRKCDELKEEAWERNRQRRERISLQKRIDIRAKEIERELRRKIRAGEIKII